MFKYEQNITNNPVLFGNFKNPVVRDYIRSSIYGGRVCAYASKYDSKVDKHSLVDFDANGLYATVMKDETIRFPDIDSCVQIGGQNLSFTNIKSNFEFYIITCDVYIPESLKFIPCASRIPGKTGCFYVTGLCKSQTYTSVDIDEMLKVGCKIISVSHGLGFKKSVSNPFASYVNFLCTE